VSILNSKSGPARLAEVGKSVSFRLSRNARVQKLSGVGLDLHVVQDFLSIDECVGLIMLVDADRVPSTVLKAGVVTDDEFRTSESCNLDRYNPLVEQIDRRICELMGIGARHGETIQGQRYAPGQQFKPHNDYFYPSEPYWEDMRKTGGQRSWTAMIYLNEPGGGGETNFTNAGLSVTPRTGMLLMWNNMDAKGEPNPQTMHEGAPVVSGIKFIVTKWFRERFWT
jgi:prolyl 4-hydroxylase